ncbi:MAG: hypothetical protein PQJ60_02170, partial [Spirochaetales bacterium]|nr:hypothetical protein [Spirochaetales bacterium]
MYESRYMKYGYERFLKDKSIERISIRFDRMEHGWIVFNINLRNVSIEINLSSIIDPFRDILKWVKEIYHGNKASSL